VREIGLIAAPVVQRGYHRIDASRAGLVSAREGWGELSPTVIATRPGRHRDDPKAKRQSASTMNEPRPALVCLTPVRNEAWVLERFLRSAAVWADLIIVLDQASDDGSVDIARSHEKVHLAQYPHTSFDEAVRRHILIDLARSLVTSPRVLVALDADEVMACNVWQHPEMRAFMASPPGTQARMRWVNVMPDEPRAWIPPDGWTDFMYVDDGRDFQGEPIHGPRLPRPAPSQIVDLPGPKVIHLQYLDWERMRAKQRWYQAHERIDHPRDRPIQIYRRYHKMDAIDPAERHPLDDSWYRDYVIDEGIDLFAVTPADAYPTDGRLMDLIEEHGPDIFRRTDIWDAGWPRRAQALGRSAPSTMLSDPRNSFERAVFRWLARTQPRALDPSVRWVQRALRVAGW
jgi:glycosyltransferase involved in cell wall biosynthesis